MTYLVWNQEGNKLGFNSTCLSSPLYTDVLIVLSLKTWPQQRKNTSNESKLVPGKVHPNIYISVLFGQVI